MTNFRTTEEYHHPYAIRFERTQPAEEPIKQQYQRSFSQISVDSTQSSSSSDDESSVHISKEQQQHPSTTNMAASTRRYSMFSELSEDDLYHEEEYATDVIAFLEELNGSEFGRISSFFDGEDGDIKLPLVVFDTGEEEDDDNDVDEHVRKLNERQRRPSRVFLRKRKSRYSILSMDTYGSDYFSVIGDDDDESTATNFTYVDIVEKRNYQVPSGYFRAQRTNVADASKFLTLYEEEHIQNQRKNDGNETYDMNQGCKIAELMSTTRSKHNLIGALARQRNTRTLIFTEQEVKEKINNNNAMSNNNNNKNNNSNKAGDDEHNELFRFTCKNTGKALVINKPKLVTDAVGGLKKIQLHPFHNMKFNNHHNKKCGVESSTFSMA